MDRDPDEQPADDIEAQRGDQPGERQSRRLLESEDADEPPMAPCQWTRKSSKTTVKCRAVTDEWNGQRDSPLVCPTPGTSDPRDVLRPTGA